MRLPVLVGVVDKKDGNESTPIIILPGVPAAPASGAGLDGRRMLAIHLASLRSFLRRQQAIPASPRSRYRSFRMHACGSTRVPPDAANDPAKRGHAEAASLRLHEMNRMRISGRDTLAITSKRLSLVRLEPQQQESLVMNKLACITLATLVGLGCLGTSRPSHAQVVVAEAGPAPDCPYGYYDYAPYPCAPYGYYGPEWFSGGIFIGAGPWFHGRHDFYGHVDNRFDGRRGFHGPFPNRGERPDPARHFDHMPSFHGNEMRDGRGHIGH